MPVSLVKACDPQRMPQIYKNMSGELKISRNIATTHSDIQAVLYKDIEYISVLLANDPKQTILLKHQQILTFWKTIRLQCFE